MFSAWRWTTSIFLLFSALCALLFENCDAIRPSEEHARDTDLEEPDWPKQDHAGHARWLVHNADYAVVSEQSTLQDGFPFGNVLSISDGPPGHSTGRILFYVATISRFARDVAEDDRVSVAVSQEQAGNGQGCQNLDPEWPMCARMAVLGRAKKIQKEGEAEAAELMFGRHPDMARWAALAHKWAFYELDIEKAYILDFFGGFHEVSHDEYFAAQPSKPPGATV